MLWVISPWLGTCPWFPLSLRDKPKVVGWADKALQHLDAFSVSISNSSKAPPGSPTLQPSCNWLGFSILALLTIGKIVLCQGNCFVHGRILSNIRLPGGSDCRESACNAEDQGLIPGSGRFPWRRKWLSTPIFLPGEFHGQRSLVGYSPWNCRVRHDWATNTFSSIPIPLSPPDERSCCCCCCC